MRLNVQYFVAYFLMIMYFGFFTISTRIASMATVALMHEEMHQRTRQKNEEWQN